jgi:dihydrolipoyl dehydrogenase
VERILGHRASIDCDVVPAGIFTLPEIGRVGLTEAQARERADRNGGLNRSLSVHGVGKGLGHRNTTGFCKVSQRRTERCSVSILWGHMRRISFMRPRAIKLGATVSQVGDMIHAHPTLGEGMMEAAEDADGKGIHQLKKKVG